MVGYASSEKPFEDESRWNAQTSELSIIKIKMKQKINCRIKHKQEKKSVAIQELQPQKVKTNYRIDGFKLREAIHF